MKSKAFLMFLLVSAFFVVGSIFYFRFSLAQTQPPAETTVTPVNECDKKMMDKLDKVLSNQDDIIARLVDLDRLVKTRKVD